MREYARYEEQSWHPERISEDRPTGNALAWILVGIGVGAGLALLLAPTSGRELRGSIARSYRRTIDGISHGTQELRQRGASLINFKRKRSEEPRSLPG